MLSVTGAVLSRPPGCRCRAACELPCWQRVGWADPCGACGCAGTVDGRGRVAGDEGMERCGACAALKAASGPCEACGWVSNA